MIAEVLVASLKMLPGAKLFGSFCVVAIQKVSRMHGKQHHDGVFEAYTVLAAA